MVENKVQDKLNFFELDHILNSEYSLNVRRRIFRQLLESFIFEGIIQPTVTIIDEETILYNLQAVDREGKAIRYQFEGRKKKSFERIRLSNKPVRRIVDAKNEEACSLATFLLEISKLINLDDEMLSSFIDEINQTFLKDSVAQNYRQQQSYKKGISYDELEGDVMDGHPYHPCYKSRIGFDLIDNFTYGPEFKQVTKLIWVAVKKEDVKISISENLEYNKFLETELGEKTIKKFSSIIAFKNKDIRDYILIPVHPWQYREEISRGFIEQFSNQNMIFLGEEENNYRPQQSIRTLANYSFPEKAYVKLPLSIINTSSGRILSQHTILNAAKISDWLGCILDNDFYLKEECRLIFLKENLGVSYNHQKLPNLLEAKVYGTLGAIWRESIHQYLEVNEEAIPFNALATIDIKGKPLIDSWIKNVGVESWLKRLLNISIKPLIHLLYKYGISMESHAQNMILIHQEGKPKRIALKDFHDGIRFSRKYLNDLNEYPEIELPPLNHPRLNRNSFIELKDPTAIKDFFQDAFFFVNLCELALFLEKHYNFNEEEFWSLTAEVIQQYQSEFPDLAERFSTFNLFSEKVEVEQLARRRLFPESSANSKFVENPLYFFKNN